MNRRRFLTMLGLSPLVAKAAPLLKFFPGSDADYYRRLHAERGPDAWVSYRYHMTVTLPPNTGSRIRFIDCAEGERKDALPVKTIPYRTYIMAQEGILS